jgi:hypothetical protein
MKSLLILFVLLLSSCIKPPDIFVCRDLHSKKEIIKDNFGIETISIKANPVCLKEINETRCGFCVKTISNKIQYVGENEKYFLDGKPWSEVRLSGVLLPLESYAK